MIKNCSYHKNIIHHPKYVGGGSIYIILSTQHSALSTASFNSLSIMIFLTLFDNFIDLGHQLRNTVFEFHHDHDESMLGTGFFKSL